MPGLNVVEPRRGCGPELGQCLRDKLPAAARAFYDRRHGSRQIGFERRARHYVSVGARIERGERRLESRGSRNDHYWRRQTESAKLLYKRGAALRLHLDDDSRGVAVALQPFKGGGRCLGPCRASSFVQFRE